MVQRLPAINPDKREAGNPRQKTETEDDTLTGLHLWRLSSGEGDCPGQYLRIT